MNATLLYRIAAVLLILFAAGHTVGFLNFKPATPEGLAVRDGMFRVTFAMGDSGSYTYGGFYVGFGLFVTAYMLFAAYVAWYLGGLARTAPQAIGMLGWVFCAVQLACLMLSVIYFFTAPIVFSVLVVLCLGWAAWLAQGAAVKAR